MMEPPPWRTISGMACLQVSIWLRQIDRQCPFPDVEGQVGHRGVPGQEVRVGQRRVVVEHVEPSEVVGHRPDGANDRRFIGQVGDHGECLAARRPDRLGDPVGPGRIDIQDGHRSPLTGEGVGRGSTDASGAPGDQGHLSGHPSLVSVAHRARWLSVRAWVMPVVVVMVPPRHRTGAS